MRMTLGRHRRKQFPALPPTRSAINLPAALQLTTSGQQFLLHAAAGNDRLIFASVDDLRLLCASTTICMDGTFDTAPALYSQIFTIHGFDQDKLLPLVYVLMNDKRRDSYEAVFTVLQNEAANLGLQLQPTVILSDFESGLFPAVRNCFPNALHKGCHFHMCQAIYRQIQSLGLVQAFNQRAEIKLQVRQLMALAFLPVAIVRITFYLLEQQCDPVLQSLFAYFIQQWLTAVPPTDWNVYGLDMRTNNHCEGWHMRFANAIGRHHPNIYQLVKCLQQEQASVVVLHQQIIAGRQARRHDKVFVSLEKRLQQL
jgi:hypothetical protein